MQKGRCKHFDRAAAFAKTRREIERHARHKHAADTADLPRWLIAWRWFNPWSKDPVGAVIEAARRMGRKHLTVAQAEDIIEEAGRIRKRVKADDLARWLGVTYAEREKLKLTRIGACDIGKRARIILRRRKHRLRQERRRRENGAKPRSEYLAQSLSRIRPWEARGLSRRQWYRVRRQQARSAVASIATAQDAAACLR
jgi:hypothetical protein